MRIFAVKGGEAVGLLLGRILRARGSTSRISDFDFRTEDIRMF